MMVWIGPGIRPLKCIVQQQRRQPRDAEIGKPGRPRTVLRFEVKVAVLWSISKIETQKYDFFESYALNTI